MNQIKQEILRAIGLSEDQYSEAVFNTAMEYLEEKAGKWTADISQTKSFWAWWQYQWAVIDEIFYAELQNKRFQWDTDIALYIWQDDHAMDMKKVNIPNTVWAEWQCNMMHDVTKEIANREEAAAV